MSRSSCGVLIKMASCAILVLVVICLPFSESRDDAATGPCSLAQGTTGSPLMGAYIAQCTDGWYTPQQCHRSTGACWCVTKNGTEIADTRTGPREERVSCDQDVTTGPCSAEQDTTGVLGAYIAQCTVDGWFTPRQCQGSSGYCWCVTKNGTEITDTRTGPGKERVSCVQAQTYFPGNVTFSDVKYTSLVVHWSVPSYNGSDITHYGLFYVKTINKNTSVYLTSGSLSPNMTRYSLTGLKPGTSYSVYVMVFYASGFNASSPQVAQITDGWNGPDRPCDCDPVGSNTTRACPYKTGQCVCLALAKGKRCDKCVTSAYKHRGRGCMPCHCPGDRSHGSCSVTPKGLLQCHCTNHTHGLRCDGCEQGYYKSHNLSSCVPCDCNGNSEECDIMTGACQKCELNTTGAHCHLCLPGCDGDALQQNCTCSRGIAPGAAILNHHRTAIAVAISVTVIAAIVIVAVLVYKYCHQPSKPFTFWTVELRDDHENVNFSSLMEQPEFQNVDATLLIDDTRGSDAEDRRTIVKNSPYQPVHS